MKSDLQLQQDVMDELKWDPILTDIAPHIGVISRDGIVTLSGTVDTYTRKHAAEAAAQRVRGVSFVAVDIDVEIGSQHKRDDSVVANDIKEALKRLAVVDFESLDVKVDAGVVTLDGMLRWNYQRQAAEEYVRNITGVVQVINNIELTNGQCDPRAIKEGITAALHRYATLDAASIQVEIDGKKAVLKGKVRSWVEKKDAENAVWASPGVSIVDNRIEVVSPYVA